MSDLGLYDSMKISAMGMRAQGARIRVIAENMANADTAALTPDGDPYQRKVITFKNVLDKETGLDLVQVEKVAGDTKNPYTMKYLPDHPGANDQGYVKMPNINTLIEVMDMREAQRSYEANLGIGEMSRSMTERTIDLLRA